jgi:A/G-specific adenine glycosylase
VAKILINILPEKYFLKISINYYLPAKYYISCMSFSEDLIVWFERNKRKLPWRENKDPYQIWLSEVILQQTRVEQGKPYYYRFIDRFPDVFSLATASEQEVLKLWEGLGYYSRARNLHFAAKQIVNDYSGKFPDDYNEIIKLKGVGKYTAAAIASIAYDQFYAVVDGNVQRVLSRVYQIKETVNSSKGIKLIESIAGELLPMQHPGDHNQAMMELGAMICTPRSPKCENCPVNTYCGAFKNKDTQLYPVKEKKAKVINRYFNYVFIIDDGYTYIKERIKGDIWQGLWEPLLIESNSEKALTNIQNTLALNFQFDKIKIVFESNIIIHQLTHRKIICRFYVAFAKDGSSLSVNYERVNIKELNEKAFPVLIRNFIETSEFGNYVIDIAK